MTTSPTLTPTHPLRIARAGVSDLPRVARTLATSFFDDPVFRWTCPDDGRRRTLLAAFFALIARTVGRHDETYLAGPAAGAAIWVPPGRPAVREDDAEEFGLRLEAMAGPDAERVFAISELIDEHHPAGEYLFLQFVGVDPLSRGRGIGSALLVHMLERCDRDGTRAYLDATSPDNRRLYERHGFRVAGEYAPPGGPPLWAMWREPGARR